MLFPVCKVASDGTVYAAYSDGGNAIYLTHSRDHGQKWSLPVRVSNLQTPSVSLMPWIETGERPGSVAIVWYGSEAATNEPNAFGVREGVNNDNTNWRVFFAETLNATSSNPTFYQTVATDHFIHASNISVLGLSGAAVNRNLADFFQVAIDPQGLAFIAFADDSNDFAGHTYATHQVGGLSLHTGKKVSVHGKDSDSVDTSAPQVRDFRHDARIDGRPPTHPEADTPVDIVNIAYGCQLRDGASLLTATMNLSGMNAVPPTGSWRINFATNPTTPGLSDRADQWFLRAQTDASGNRTYTYGTAIRNSSGGITYTDGGTADIGQFDLTVSSLTLQVDVKKLNALQTRGAIGPGTTLIGLRGSASVIGFSITVQGVTTTVGLSDNTRGGTSFKLPGACFGS